MAILKRQAIVMEEVDTDSFTKEQWKQFIKDNVNADIIINVIKNTEDKATTFQILKNEAVKTALANQEIQALFQEDFKL